MYSYGKIHPIYAYYEAEFVQLFMYAVEFLQVHLLLLVVVVVVYNWWNTSSLFCKDISNPITVLIL